MHKNLRFILSGLVVLLWLSPSFAKYRDRHDCSYYLQRKPEVARPSADGSLTLTSLNTQNLRHKNGQFSKSYLEMTKMVDALMRRDPSIIILQEIVSREAVEELNRLHLQNRFKVYYDRSTSNNHRMAFLVRHSLRMSVQFEQLGNVTWIDPVDGVLRPLFTHGLGALVLTEHGREHPSLVLIGHHGKSKKNRDGDPKSHLLRKAQVQGLRAVSEQYRERLGAAVPVVIMGDFNTNLDDADEMRPMSDMRNIFDLVGLAPDQRGSQMSFTESGTLIMSPIDGAFIDPDNADSVTAGGIDHYYVNGQEVLPRTAEERELDHFPVWLVIRLSRTHQ